MKGKWLTVFALLFGAETQIKGFDTNTDGSVHLLEEHMDTIESTLKTQAEKIAANEGVLKTATDAQAAAEAEVKTLGDKIAALNTAVADAATAKETAESLLSAQNAELETLRAKVAGIPAGEGKDPKNTGAEGGDTPKNETPWRIKK
jgi:chromosome segregation ATPase